MPRFLTIFDSNGAIEKVVKQTLSNGEVVAVADTTLKTWTYGAETVKYVVCDDSGAVHPIYKSKDADFVGDGPAGWSDLVQSEYDAWLAAQ